MRNAGKQETDLAAKNAENAKQEGGKTGEFQGRENEGGGRGIGLRVAPTYFRFQISELDCIAIPGESERGFHSQNAFVKWIGLFI